MRKIIKRYLKIISFTVVLVFLSHLLTPAFGETVYTIIGVTDPTSTITNLVGMTAYLDPVLKVDLAKLPSHPWGYNGTEMTESDAVKEKKASGVYFVVKAANNPPSYPAKAWGEVWCDVFYIEKGAKLEVSPYVYNYTKQKWEGGWLEIHAKVIRIEGEINASGAGYLGTYGGDGDNGGQGGNGELGGAFQPGSATWGLSGAKGNQMALRKTENGPGSPAEYPIYSNGGSGSSGGDDGGYGGKAGSAGAYGKDAKYSLSSITMDPKNVDNVLMGSGGQGGQQGGGGGGGGGGEGSIWGPNGGSGGKGGRGGKGGTGGRGGGAVKLHAKYSLIFNGTIKSNGKPGTSGAKGVNGINGSQGENGGGAGGAGGIYGDNPYGTGLGVGQRGSTGGANEGDGGGGGGAGGRGGSGGGGSGGGVLFKCYSPLAQILGINSSIGTLGIVMQGMVDVQGAYGSTAGLSTSNAGVLKVVYAGNTPSVGTVYGTKLSYQLPLLEISSPAGGEYYSKNVPIKWIVKSTSVPLSGWGRISYLDIDNTWKIIVSGLNSSKTGTGTKDWEWYWDVSNVSNSKNVQLKIEATDSNGNVGLVQSRIFTVDHEAPEAPTKVTVNDSVVVLSSTPTGGWTKVNPRIYWGEPKEHFSGVGDVQVAIRRYNNKTYNLENVILDSNYKYVKHVDESASTIRWISVSKLADSTIVSLVKDGFIHYGGNFAMDASTWPSGEYQFAVRVIDRAGNIGGKSDFSGAYNSTYKRDGTAPAMELKDMSGNIVLLLGQWVNKNKFELAVTDNDSGIKKYAYAVNDINNKKWTNLQNYTTTHSAAFDVPEGLVKLWFYSEDNLGNINDNWPLGVNPWLINVDTKSPTVNVASPGKLCSSVTDISGTCSDPGAPTTGSGVTTVEVYLFTTTYENFSGGILYWNGSTWEGGTSADARVYEITPDASGNWKLDGSLIKFLAKDKWSYRVVAKAIDKAGNTSKDPITGEDLEYEFTIDKSTPAVSFKVDGEPVTTPKPWYTSGIGYVTLDLSTNKTGTFSCKIVDAATGATVFNTTKTAPASVTTTLTDGKYVVSYEAIDDLNNSLKESKNINVDTKAPTAAITYPQKYDETTKLPVYASVGVISGTMQDAVSGIGNLEICVETRPAVGGVFYYNYENNAVSWVTTKTWYAANLNNANGTWSVTLPVAIAEKGPNDDGRYGLLFRAYDNAGNKYEQVWETGYPARYFMVEPTAGAQQAPSAPAGLNISVVNTNQLKLSWTAVPDAASYTVYCAANSPYFTKQVATFTKTVSTTTWTETAVNVMGDAYNNYFYFVTATNYAGESGPSNRVGVINYELVSGINWIAVPLTNSNLKTASDLWNSLGLSKGDLIEKPDAGKATYNEYYGGNDTLLGVIGVDFAVTLGGCYRVTTSSQESWTLVGNVPDSESKIFNLVSGINWVYLPLSETAINKASDLWSSLGLVKGDLLEKPDAGKATYNEYYGGNDTLLGVIGTDFTITSSSVNCYRITTGKAIQWP